MEFLHQAKQLTHPYDKEVRLPKEPKDVAKVMWKCAKFGPNAVDSQRQITIEYYRQRAKALEAQ